MPTTVVAQHVRQRDTSGHVEHRRRPRLVCAEDQAGRSPAAGQGQMARQQVDLRCLRRCQRTAAVRRGDAVVGCNCRNPVRVRNHRGAVRLCPPARCRRPSCHAPVKRAGRPGSAAAKEKAPLLCAATCGAKVQGRPPFPRWPWCHHHTGARNRAEAGKSVFASSFGSPERLSRSRCRLFRHHPWKPPRHRGPLELHLGRDPGQQISVAQHDQKSNETVRQKGEASTRRQEAGSSPNEVQESPAQERNQGPVGTGRAHPKRAQETLPGTAPNDSRALGAPSAGNFKFAKQFRERSQVAAGI